MKDKNEYFSTGWLPAQPTEETVTIDGQSVAVLGDTLDKVPTEACDVMLYVLLRFKDGTVGPFEQISGRDLVDGPLVNPRAVAKEWLSVHQAKLDSHIRARGAVWFVFGIRPPMRPARTHFRPGF